MTPTRRAGGALVPAVLALAAAGCTDDGNDQALRAERAEQLAAEFRADPTTTTVADTTDAATAPPTTTTTVARTGVVVPVIALDNSFRPEVVQISVGDEVLWENRGVNEHDVLYVEGGGWGVEVEAFQPGDVYAHVFTEPGEYRYFCSIHGNEDVGMVGTVVVSE